MLRTVAFLLAALGSAPVLADLYEICWDLPTLDVNGNPVEGLGVRVYTGDDEIANVGWVSCAQVELLVGTHDISVAAYNAQGEAPRSPGTALIVEPLPPGVPTAMGAPTLSFLMVGGGGAAGTPAPPAVAGYTLASVGVIPFVYSEPEAPRGELVEVEVTPATFADNNVSGRRIILTAGDYTGVNFGSISLGTDQELVTTTGVIIDRLDLTSATRVIVRADPVRSGTINKFDFGGGNGASDVLINGIYTDSTALTDERNLISGNRIAIINSRIRTKDFTLASFPGDASGPNDIIIANNDLHAYGSTQAANRFQNIQRLVMVDNRVQKTGSGHHNLRFHVPATTGDGTALQNSDNLYVARNQFEGPYWSFRPIPGGIGSGDPHGRLINVWSVDNTIYFNGGWSIQTGTTADGDYPEVVTITGNQAFISSGGFPTAGQHPWSATISDNSVSGYTSPPTWTHQ